MHNVFQALSLRRDFFMLVSFLVIFLGCGKPPAVGELDNFRGLKWGSDPSTLSGSVRIAQEGDLEFYEKQTENLDLNGVRLDQVIYGFHKGRFYTAMIYFKKTGISRVKELLSRQLGEPMLPDKTPSKLVWDGPDVTVLLTSSDDSELARLAYLYKPIQLEIEIKK